MDYSALIEVLPLLLATLIGAAAGTFGTIVAAKIGNKSDRRRLAMEAGLREWEQHVQFVSKRGGAIYPLVLFTYFNNELVKLIDRDKLTPERYRLLFARYDEMKRAIEEHSGPRLNRHQAGSNL